MFLVYFYKTQIATFGLTLTKAWNIIIASA